MRNLSKNYFYFSLPSLITMDATDLRLDGSNFTVLDASTFLGRGRLQKLYLSRCNVGSIGNQTFVILGELRVLDLSKNDLKQLRGDEFHGLSVLRELNLQNNQVQTFIIKFINN